MDTVSYVEARRTPRHDVRRRRRPALRRAARHGAPSRPRHPSRGRLAGLVLPRQHINGLGRLPARQVRVRAGRRCRRCHDDARTCLRCRRVRHRVRGQVHRPQPPALPARDRRRRCHHGHRPSALRQGQRVSRLQKGEARWGYMWRDTQPTQAVCTSVVRARLTSGLDSPLVRRDRSARAILSHLTARSCRPW